MMAGGQSNWNCVGLEPAITTLRWRIILTREAYLVGDFADVETRFVQDGNDSFVICLDEIANNFVVKVLDCRPSDSFALILLLLLPQHQLCRISRNKSSPHKF